ncbi:hypothetical protein LINPERPRIM_LOCUS22580 [Linum perenne]
MCIINLSY